MQEFHRNNLPSPVDTWPQYRKVVATHALRVEREFSVLMEGEFSVLTTKVLLHCKDGYLCIDARGYPYPVAKEEFDMIYVLAAQSAYESPPVVDEVVDPSPGDVAIGGGAGQLVAGPPPPPLQQNQAFRGKRLAEDGDEGHYE